MPNSMMKDWLDATTRPNLTGGILDMHLSRPHAAIDAFNLSFHQWIGKEALCPPTCDCLQYFVE